VDDIIQAHREIARRFAGHPDVTAVHIGARRAKGRRTDEVGIVVSVRKKLPTGQLAIDRRLPDRIGRYHVDVLERTFDVRRLGSCPTDRPGIGESCRPLRAGTLLSTLQVRPRCDFNNGKGSIHQFDSAQGISRGTLGSIVVHSSGKVCALTNQHVATSTLVSDAYPGGDARSFTGVSAWQGYPALDPRPFGKDVVNDKQEYDRARSCCFWLCGAAADPPSIGRVFVVADVPIDAALIALTGGLEYRNELPDGTQFGSPLSATELGQLVNTEVIKRGHATHLTTGIVTDADPPDSNVMDSFGNCLRDNPPTIIIETTKPSDGQNNGEGYFQSEGVLYFAVDGDSGSLVLRKDNKRIVGLLYGMDSVERDNRQGIPAHNGMVIDIQRVITALGIQSFPAGGTTVPVPPNNLDGVPTNSYLGTKTPGRFAPSFAEMDDERLWTFRQLVSRSSRGAAALARFERMRAEISDLMGRYRRVRIAWHKNHGPTLGWKFQRMLLEPDIKLPEILVDKPLRACIEDFSAVIAGIGSSELQQDLSRLPDLAAALPQMTRDDLLRYLGAPSWHASL